MPSWMKKLIDSVSKVPNTVLGAVAAVGGLAAAGAAILTPLGWAPAVAAVLTKVAVSAGAFSIVAAKALPGHGENRSANAAPGVDPETPKAPR